MRKKGLIPVSFSFLYRSRDHDQIPYFLRQITVRIAWITSFRPVGAAEGWEVPPKTPVPGHRERPPLLALASVEGAVTHPDVQPPAKIKTWHLFACAWGAV